jgi:hypothetical protein
VFNDYNGSIYGWLQYVSFYKQQKIEKRLYERYTANFIGKLAGAVNSYDDILQRLEDAISNKPKRTADNIKHDLLIKFNKRS